MVFGCRALGMLQHRAASPWAGLHSALQMQPKKTFTFYAAMMAGTRPPPVHLETTGTAATTDTTTGREARAPVLAGM